VDIVVGAAAKLVGKKVTATITAVTEGLAWAELVAPAEVADEPLTAESEAEKPTRVKRSTARKTAETETEDAVAIEDGAEVAEVEADEELEPEEDVEAVGATEGDDALPGVPKRRTGGGSRGGR